MKSIDEMIIEHEEHIILAQNMARQQGRFHQFKNWEGNKDLQVDEYDNGAGISGWCIRAYKEENGIRSVKVIDYGNGGFDTFGWVKAGEEQ